MSNASDREYIEFLQRLQATFKQRTAGRPVFTTNVDKGELWKQYLSSFSDQQFHNCNACHAFLSRYAGLVVIADNGEQQSAMWKATTEDGELYRAIRRMADMARVAKINGVFYSDQSMLGHDVTNGWRHLHLFNTKVFTAPKLSAAQAMAEKREEFAGLSRAMREFSAAIAAKAVALLKSGALYRPEKVLPQAEWLADLYEQCSARTGQQNLLWLAVAKAPPGFGHVRSKMLGKLMADIQAGTPLTALTEKFNAAMDRYQESSNEPTDNQIAVAEQAVADMNIAPAFARRYTTIYDFAKGGMVWMPQVGDPPAPLAAKLEAAGVFDVLKTKAQVAADKLEVPPRTMTMEKFLRDVLPGAARIAYRVPTAGRFAALTTAQDPDAPPILQWDTPEVRNPVSWAFATQPAYAEHYGLTPGSLVPVRGIVNTPNLWGEVQQEHHGKGVFLLLEGACDKRGLPGGGLFVEHLRGDLRPYRRTIEAYMNKLVVSGAEEPSTAAFGIGLLAGNDWTEQAAPKVVALTGASAPKRVHVLLVVDDSGSMKGYLGAAQRAVRHLLDASGAMPGEVDYTVFKFGYHTHRLTDRSSLENARDCTVGLRGDSGATSLNDAIGQAINTAQMWARTPDTAFFLGIVTDGEENHSTEFTVQGVRLLIEKVLSTGEWTIAFAGAGRNPRDYAESIGIPAGNIAEFSASAKGFEDIGNRYAASTRSLAAGYKAGVRASTTFFSAASGREAIGTGHPVLEVTSKSGARSAYLLDRWE